MVSSHGRGLFAGLLAGFLGKLYCPLFVVPSSRIFGHLENNLFSFDGWQVLLDLRFNQFDAHDLLVANIFFSLLVI